MLTIQLKNLEFKAFHGLYAEEKILGNTFIVNLTVRYTVQSNSIVSLDETVNYEKLFTLVKNEMDIPTPLLETIVMNIANKIFNQFGLVQEVDICIEKKNPPIKKMVGSVAVSLNKKR